MSLAVVVEGSQFGIRLRDSANGPSPTISTFSIFVNEIAQMDYVVNRVFACRVAEGIEEAEIVVRARVYR